MKVKRSSKGYLLVGWLIGLVDGMAGDQFFFFGL